MRFNDRSADASAARGTGVDDQPVKTMVRDASLDKPVQQPQTELDGMSDTDLVNELAKQANELGVKIDLSYKFGEGE